MSELWCNEQGLDENGRVICLAHLAEARVFDCPYKDAEERLKSKYHCSNFRRR